MKKIFLASLAMALSITCLAEETPVLTIKTDIAETTIQLKDISKVQYTDAEMIVNLNDGSTKVFVIEDITLMTFNDINISTAIYSAEGKQSTATEIFDLNGIKKGDMKKKGMYIIKVGKETKKIKK